MEPRTEAPSRPEPRQGVGAEKHTVLELPLRFAAHVVVATAMFIIIGLAGVGLHRFVDWMAEMGVASWMTGTARFLEFSVFGLDVLLFAAFLVRTGATHLALMWKSDAD